MNMQLFRVLSFSLLLCILSKSINTAVATKRFVIRQDDIEDYYHSQTQINLLSFFMDRGIAVSAGIIGNYFTGQDIPLYNTLKRCVGLGPDKCSLFNHGEDATYTYDQATSTSIAYSHMKVCDDKIKSLFPNYQVELFVPHQNAWNQYTLAAALQLGYTAVSASVLPYSNMPYDTTKTPLQLSEQTETGEYLPSGLWAANPIKDTLSTCERVAAAGQVCVIMTHPHEFAQGAYNWTMLQWLVNNLTKAGFTSVSFHTIIQEAKGTQLPTLSPSVAVTGTPTISPSAMKTGNPTFNPSTRTVIPTFNPTPGPTVGATTNPTRSATLSSTSVTAATKLPSAAPTINPTVAITAPPTLQSTALPTITPFKLTTATPSISATSIPTLRVTVAPTVNRRRYLFRFDNVQDFTFSSFTIFFINYCLDFGYGVSIGIIGNKVTGKDIPLYNTLKRCASIGADRCNLFVEGADTTFVFASAPSVDAAKAEIQATSDRIESLFPGYVSQVFVPTQNSCNDYTVAAVKALGFTAISGSKQLMSWNLTSNPIQLPQQTSTGIQVGNGTWQGNPTNRVVSDCSIAADRGEVCVIQVTANEFASGAYNSGNVQELVTGLKAAGFTDSITFHTIINEVQGNKPSTAPTQGPQSAASESKSDALSYPFHPASYMIAVIAVTGALLIAGLCYVIILRRRRVNERLEKKSKETNTDLDSISSDNLLEFTVEQNENKLPPSSLRISAKYSELRLSSPSNSPLAKGRTSLSMSPLVSPSSPLDFQEVEIV